MAQTDLKSTGAAHATALTLSVLACVLLASGAAWHIHAAAQYRSSLATGIPLETRFAHAQTAAALEPWNARYTRRVRLVESWLRADTLLAAGDYKDAVLLLTAAMGRTPAEPELLALYRKAQEIQSEETNRKAHLQHGHEGPGGTLAPSDIER